jgi:ribokinase
MNNKGIVVVGSINIDMVFSLPRLPLKGETISGGSFAAHPGGKGANQAVAAARLGMPTTFLGCVGEDSWGDILLAGLQQTGVDCAHVERVPGPSGCAGIYVDARGENMIAVATGANSQITPLKVRKAQEIFSTSNVLMTQLEIPVETVVAALELAKGAGLITILDPAPVKSLPPYTLSLVDYITPNAPEASELAGIDVHCWSTAAQAASKLRAMGPKNVVITMGKLGAFFSGPQGQVRIAAPGVDAVDSTAAGDAFNGAFAVAIAQGAQPDIAADIAAVAGALAVSKAGAQPSLPTLAELAQVVSLPW